MTTDLVTLTDVKAHLNIPTSDTSNDTELGGFIDAASDFITYIAGPVVSTPLTETHRTRGGLYYVMLRQPPVLSITSVVEYVGTVGYTLTQQQPGSTVDNWGYSINLASGALVRRSSAGTRMPFLGGDLVVAYVAGRVSVPPQIRLACLEDIRGLWQRTQLGGRPAFDDGGSSGSDGWTSGPLNLFPRLKALLDGATRTPSIA